MVDRVVYILFFIGISLFRVIPFSLLYLLSYLAYVLIFYVTGYRKQVTIDNLSKCFPDKGSDEIFSIAKAFFKHNLAAIFAEGLKGFTMGQGEFVKRYKVVNPEVLTPFFNSGQDVIAIASHYCNWEWGIQAVDVQIDHQAAALYKPLSNKFIEKFSKNLREKSGMKLISINDTLAYFKSKKDKPVVYIMAADQFPGGTMDKAIWVDFLGRDTPCLHGPESYARFNKLPVLFFDVQRVSRGCYELELKLLAEKPWELEKGEVTKRYMNNLEQSILNKPENWLWSHKRWKHETAHSLS